jgi:hypothetical protein
LATKVAVGIVFAQGQEPTVLERWFSEAVDVRDNHDISEQIVRFLRHHDVKSVVSPDRIIGCPHEEGIDYPDRGICPQCPFWANRDRWTGEVEP